MYGFLINVTCRYLRIPSPIHTCVLHLGKIDELSPLPRIIACSKRSRPVIKFDKSGANSPAFDWPDGFLMEATTTKRSFNLVRVCFWEEEMCVCGVSSSEIRTREEKAFVGTGVRGGGSNVSISPPSPSVYLLDWRNVSLFSLPSKVLDRILICGSAPSVPLVAMMGERETRQEEDDGGGIEPVCNLVKATTTTTQDNGYSKKDRD